MIDLNNYETVKMRKKKFYADYPDGRIIVEIQNQDVLEHALFKATIYKTKEEQAEFKPFATGYAHEIRDKELKTSNTGKPYESVNYTSWVENCEESAIGRALDNAGYAGNDKCSREEMQKVKNKLENNKPVEKPKGKFEKIEAALNSATTKAELDNFIKQGKALSWTDEEVCKIDILIKEAQERIK